MVAWIFLGMLLLSSFLPFFWFSFSFLSFSSCNYLKEREREARIWGEYQKKRERRKNLSTSWQSLKHFISILHIRDVFSGGVEPYLARFLSGLAISSEFTGSCINNYERVWSSENVPFHELFSWCLLHTSLVNMRKSEVETDYTIYGSECWAAEVHHIHKMSVVEMWILR